MAILESDLILLKSTVITDDSTNGGLMDNNNQAISGVVNNVWDSIFRSERLAGSTKYRKTFFKVNTDNNDTLYASQVWMDNVTLADDWQVFFAGTQIDTQAGITGAENCYGCGQLFANVAAGVNTFTVVVEDTSLVPLGTDNIFRDGSTIRITNQDSPTSGIGTSEFHVIFGTPTVSGNEVTITIVDTLANAYNTNDNLYGTRVMSVLEQGDVKCSTSAYSFTTAGDGAHNSGSYPAITDNIGTIEQTVTLTFTDATNFTATSNVSGVTLTGGSTGVNYSPLNPDNSKPYFTLESLGFSGTWANGDTLTFSTHPACVPFWQKRVVPAGLVSVDGNKAVYCFSGEGV